MIITIEPLTSRLWLGPFRLCLNGSTYVYHFFIRQYIGDILFPEIQEEDEAEHDSLPCQSGSLRPLDWIRKSTPSPVDLAWVFQ